MGRPKAREAETHGERLTAEYIGTRFNGTHALMLGRMIDIAIREERERCARLVEGQVYKEHYRKWPGVSGGNLSAESEVAKHCQAIANVIRAGTDK